MWCNGLRTTNPQTEASHRMHFPRRLKMADMSTKITACPHLWGWRQRSIPSPPKWPFHTSTIGSEVQMCEMQGVQAWTCSSECLFFFGPVACFEFSLWVSVKCPWDQWHIKAETGAHSWTISCSDCKVGVGENVAKQCEWEFGRWWWQDGGTSSDGEEDEEDKDRGQSGEGLKRRGFCGVFGVKKMRGSAWSGGIYRCLVN